MKLHEKLLCLCLCLLLSACGSFGGTQSPSSSSSKGSDSAHSLDLQLRLARGYIERGEYAVAQEKLQKAQSINNRSPDVHTLLGFLNEKLRREDKAESHYRKALSLKSDDGGANNNLGWFLCRHKRYAEADAYFERAISDPFYKTPEMAAGNAGLCALKGNMSAKAETYLRQALSLNANQPSGLIGMAELMLQQRNYLKARAFLQRYESLGLRTPQALLLGAKIEEGNQNRQAADEYRSQLQMLYPDYPSGQ